MESEINKEERPAEEIKDLLTIRDALIKCAECLDRTEDCISEKDIKKAEEAFSKSSESFNEAFIQYFKLGYSPAFGSVK